MIRGASRAWRSDHPWAPLYDFVVENETIARVGWRVAMGSDVGLLYAAAAEIGSLPDGATVLDVPCGGGVALRGVRAGQQVRYLAADISPAMLRRTAETAAERQVIGVELLECDVARLPLADRVVDLAASFTGLHCFPDPEAAVHELARVLKPGGVLTGSAFLNDTGRRYDGVRLVGRRMGLLGRSGTRAELASWCRDAGLVDLSLRTSGALVYFRAGSPG